jgi:hypothetical protein
LRRCFFTRQRRFFVLRLKWKDMSLEGNKIGNPESAVESCPGCSSLSRSVRMMIVNDPLTTVRCKHPWHDEPRPVVAKCEKCGHGVHSLGICEFPIGYGEICECDFYSGSRPPVGDLSYQLVKAKSETGAELDVLEIRRGGFIDRRLPSDVEFDLLATVAKLRAQLTDRK